MSQCIHRNLLQAALDKTDDDRTAMSALLAYLNSNEVVSDEQTKKGFDRLYEVGVPVSPSHERSINATSDLLDVTSSGFGVAKNHFGTITVIWFLFHASLFAFGRVIYFVTTRWI